MRSTCPEGGANLQARIQRLSRMSLAANNAWSLSNEMTLPELASVSLWISSGGRLAWGKPSAMDGGRRMRDADYFAGRATQELKAAMRSSDRRVREVHLELADAYAFRLRETQREHRDVASLRVDCVA